MYKKFGTLLYTIFIHLINIQNQNNFLACEQKNKIKILKNIFIFIHKYIILILSWSSNKFVLKNWNKSDIIEL